VSSRHCRRSRVLLTYTRSINEQLRLWIIVKGFNSFIYLKYKPFTPKKKTKRVVHAPDEELPTYDRAYWTQRLKGSTSSDLNVRTIVISLNLQRYDTGSDSKVKSENTDLKALSKGISKIANTLPQDEKALINIATDPEELQPDVDGLLLHFGHKIWGQDQWQRLPMHEDDEYDPDDLVYAKPGDMKKISHFLRLWILVQAFDSLAHGNQEDDSMAEEEEEVGLDELDATLLPSEAYHAKGEEEEALIGDSDKTPSTPKAHQGLDEEEEVVLDDFGDDIEEVSRDSWRSTTHARLVSENGSESSLPVEAVEAPFEAVKIVQNIPELPEMSPLSDVPDDDEESPMALNNNVPFARAASPNRQADSVSNQVAHVEAASVIEPILDVPMVPEVAIAPTPSPLLQFEQPLRPVDAAVVDDVLVQDVTVASAPKVKANVTGIEQVPVRSVRTTRNLMATYNEAILNGRARHTPTKYFEEHHKNGMRRSPADVARENSRATPSRPRPETAKHSPAKHVQKTHGNVLRRSRPRLVQSESFDTASTPDLDTAATEQANKGLDVTEEWDERIWRRYTTGNVVPALKFMSSLGLKVRQNNSSGVADNLACNKLMKEVSKAAAELHASSSIDELVEAAADYTFFEQWIAVLVNKYAKDLWAPGVDRTHLLQAGEVEVFLKELDTKNEDDRKMLHLHLHQWIFAKAFATIRKTRAAEEKRIRELGLDGNSAQIKRGSTDSQAPQRVIQGPNKMKSSSRKRKATSKSPPPNRPHAKVPRSSTREEHVLAAQALTTAMLAYFKLAEDDTSSEADLLDHIEAQTVIYAPIPIYPFPQAMNTWLTYRRIILAVREQASTPQSSDSSEMRNKIMRARLLTDLRFARDAFVAMRVDRGVGCEECISWAFEKMAEGEKEGRKLREEIEEGFKMLDGKLKVLADGLGRGDWVFMG
jgi:hypothetical protein